MDRIGEVDLKEANDQTIDSIVKYSGNISSYYIFAGGNGIRTFTVCILTTFEAKELKFKNYLLKCFITFLSLIQTKFYILSNALNSTKRLNQIRCIFVNEESFKDK